LAVRYKHNLTTQLFETTFTNGFSNIWPNLATAEMASELFELGDNERLSSFEGKAFEGAVYLNEDREHEDLLKKRINDGNVVLAVTYGSDGKDFIPRTPDESEDRVAFGMGYEFRLSGSESRYLTSAVEYDLQSYSESPKTKSWNCIDVYRFKIVKSEDAATACSGTVGRPTCSGSCTSNEIYNQEIWDVANSVLGSEWDINPSKGCIIEKETTQGSCYPASGSYTVDYSHSPSCPIEDALKQCAHFLSICTRP